MANGDDIKDVWDAITAMGEKVGTMHLGLSKAIAEVDKKVAVALKDMETQKETLSLHLTKHWQVYLALAVPIVTSLVGIAVLAIRSYQRRI